MGNEKSGIETIAEIQRMLIDEEISIYEMTKSIIDAIGYEAYMDAFMSVMSDKYQKNFLNTPLANSIKKQSK